MRVIELLEKYTGENRALFSILFNHSMSVANRALSISFAHPELGADNDFILEASLLHDIGCVAVDAPNIMCFGSLPYLAHGYCGLEIMRKEGFAKHSLVCERHTGTGLSLKEIVERELPIPHREMVPVSIEEQIICYADLFYSKMRLGVEETNDEVRKKLSHYGNQSVEQFDRWFCIFEKE